MPGSISIALDVMSGDNGPRPAILGAIKSLKKIPDLKVDLIGNEKDIESLLETKDTSILESTKVVYDWQSWYTLRTRTMIAQLYHNDIITYGYTY